jgi:hypothetical protein
MLDYRSPVFDQTAKQWFIRTFFRGEKGVMTIFQRENRVSEEKSGIWKICAGFSPMKKAVLRWFSE